MRVILDLHDFSVLNNRLDLLLRLRAVFPGFKVSLFTVPYDIKNRSGDRKEALTEIKKHLDWMQFIPHGLYHNGSEMKSCDYKTFKNKIMPAIKKHFDRDGLPYVRGFCAPHWRWTAGVVKALDDAGWWGAISPARPDMLVPKRYYTYDMSINEPFYDKSTYTLKIHGHIGSTANDLDKCMTNLFQLSTSVEWRFVTDFIEEKV